ncbi:MAG: hypothetical protein DI551_07430 [Micavibrio aeruginosavorus]|uniref:YdbS-like PH domain-containing protein n=1 Tax=Micavibrio aeruginosavorus TaxID=349221 RepID=A0A2W5MVT7_9BACT|nr:MAG: hypothetical protein DI551_07430 [Micavibrio aeruginosavorus]
MDYVRQSLTEDEELVHVAHFHWMYTFGAVMNIIFGVLLAVFIIVGSILVQPHLPGFFKFDIPPDANWIETVRGVHPGIKIIAFLVFAMGMLRYAHMMIIKSTTEIAITNKRLIYKRGLVARFVGEMNIDRIEGVNVLQGVWGRIFGYGRVMVRGMGVGEVVLPSIEEPIRFRKAIEKARSV